MWLKRVEAERYGSLEGVSLGDLGEGLTVVLGPNEAGKSSLTALVRHVLYGFPDRRSRERGYYVEGGARHGRLVFADGAGEWAVERIDGRGSGDVAVRTIGGQERPSLHAELTRGVSADAYRVVFGFGLADMADVVGSGDDIVARLYAAGAGISVSPQDVRRVLHSQTEGLFKPGGRNPAINAAAREAAELEKLIRELRQQAEALAGNRERLAALTLQAADAAREAQAAEGKRDALDAAVRELERIEERLHTLREELVEKRTALSHSKTQAEEAVPDARVLDASSVIEAVVEEVPVHRERADRIAGQRQRIATLERSIFERFEAEGIDESAAASIQVDAETRSGVESWRDRLMRLELRAEETARAASAAANAAEAGRDGVATAAGSEVSSAVRGSVLAGWLLVVLGVLGVGGGVLSETWLLAGFAGLVALVGAWLALGSRVTHPGVAGAGDQTHLAETRRLAAEETRSAADARADAEKLDGARAEWDAWRTGRGLASADTPTAAADVLAVVSDIRRLQAERADAAAGVATESERAEAFLGRVRELAEALGIEAAGDSASAAEVVSRARGMLEEARGQLARAERAAGEAEALAPRIEALEAAEKDAESRARAIIEEQGFEGGLAQAEVFASAVSREAAGARTRFDEMDRSRATLAGEVNAISTESESSELALDLAGIRERIAALAERYVVAKVASALLDRAQQVYERERQPAVMRDAGRVLATMTAGRYGSVAVPLGSSAVEIFDQAARAKGTEVLSTGTAEQLYLSLRIALLGTLGEVGAGLPVLMDDVFANFDPQRKEGAAEAVAELAGSRQVVVFTCHPETATVLAQADPGLTRLSLDRC